MTISKRLAVLLAILGLLVFLFVLAWLGAPGDYRPAKLKKLSWKTHDELRTILKNEKDLETKLAALESLAWNSKLVTTKQDAATSLSIFGWFARNDFYETEDSSFRKGEIKDYQWLYVHFPHMTNSRELMQNACKYFVAKLLDYWEQNFGEAPPSEYRHLLLQLDSKNADETK